MRQVLVVALKSSRSGRRPRADVKNDSSTAGTEEQRLPSGSSQPMSALILHKMSPELLDNIMFYSSEPDYGPPVQRSRAAKRSSDLIRWSLVSRGLSLAAAKYIWRIVFLTSDNHAVFVQSAIDASGGRHGRVGSSIRMIYTKFRWTRKTQEIVNLASSCSTLLRLDAPVGTLGSVGGSTTDSTSFHRLRVLTLFGNRKKSVQAFDARGLAGLVALQHLTIDTRLEISPDCPNPMFSLISLAWQGDHQPEAVRWVLQKSSALRVLMIRHAAVDFLEQCLVPHGNTLLSLRLLLQGSIPLEQYPRLLHLIETHCPNLLELLLDICPELSLLDTLPRAIGHIALNPSRKSKIFTRGTFLKWIACRPNVRVTLWGSHASMLFYRTEYPFKSKHQGFNAQVPVVKEWRQRRIVHFVPRVVGEIEWPFEDAMEKDYISPVVPNRRRWGSY